MSTQLNLFGKGFELIIIHCLFIELFFCMSVWNTEVIQK